MDGNLVRREDVVRRGILDHGDTLVHESTLTGLQKDELRFTAESWSVVHSERLPELLRREGCVICVHCALKFVENIITKARDRPYRSNFGRFFGKFNFIFLIRTF